MKRYAVFCLLAVGCGGARFTSDLDLDAGPAPDETSDELSEVPFISDTLPPAISADAGATSTATAPESEAAAPEVPQDAALPATEPSAAPTSPPEAGPVPAPEAGPDLVPAPEAGPPLEPVDWSTSALSCEAPVHQGQCYFESELHAFLRPCRTDLDCEGGTSGPFHNMTCETTVTMGQVCTKRSLYTLSVGSINSPDVSAGFIVPSEVSGEVLLGISCGYEGESIDRCPPHLPVCTSMAGAGELPTGEANSWWFCAAACSAPSPTGGPHGCVQ